MFRKYRLSNGIEVISEPMENRRTVSMGVYIKVGSSDEARGQNGISHLIEHMLFKGTKLHSAREIADITTWFGDDVNAFTSKECTALYGMTVTENFREMAMLLGDMLANSLMDKKELAKEKRIVMDEIDMYADSAEDLVHEMLQKKVWREDSLGFLISGTKAVVQKVRREQIGQFMKEHYHTGNMLVSVAGSYPEGEMLTWLAEAFSGMPGNPIPAGGSHPKPEPRYFRSFACYHREIEQLHMNLAFPSICLGDARRFAYSVMNSAFGGSNNSRLFQKIREEEGLAYSVYSYSSAYGRGGLFHIDITVQPGLAAVVLEKIIGIIREFLGGGLTGEELAMHKQQVRTELIMSYENPKTRMESNAKYAMAGGGLYTLEEKIRKIDAVTCQDIMDLAAGCMDLAQCSICIVGDKGNIDIRGLKKIWNTLHKSAAGSR